jgi:hypothetical protein
VSGFSLSPSPGTPGEGRGGGVMLGSVEMKSILTLAIIAGMMLSSVGCEKTVHEASASAITER